MSPHFSDAEVELHAGPYHCVVDVVGAALRSLNFESYPLVLGGQAAAGAVLAPWPNRTAEGSFDWLGQRFQLELTEPQRNNAIHGLVMSERWQVAGQGESWCRLELAPVAPWEVQWEITYQLDGAEGLNVVLRGHNVGAQDWPVGMGFHPYLTAWGAPAEQSFFSVAVAEHIELSADRLLPTGVRELVAGFEQARVSELELDDCFRASPSGMHRAQLVNEEGCGVELTTGHPYFQIYSGGQGLAVEPQSCPPNMLRSGEGTIVLSPAQTCEGGYGLRAIVS